MKPPSEKQAASEILELLTEMLGSDPEKVRIRETAPASGFDFVVSAPKHGFMVEYRVSTSSGSLAAAVEQLERQIKSYAGSKTPLIVVPFMGKAGQQVCEKSGVSWLDLSGNARITAPGLRIWIEGRPNKFSGPGRPPNVFAPKSSRITRQLLLHPQRSHTQSELARQTELDDGYVSKVVRRLLQENLLATNNEGAVLPRDPNLLLDAWHSAYDFSGHRILKGHVPSRSGDELMYRLAKKLSQLRLDYAATGLAAAWLFTHFATFRIATFYLRSMPPASLLKTIEFWDEPKGANTWLVVPSDEGVLHGSQALEGVKCVSPVQTYLDLKDHPERAKEAADELRKRCLNWGFHGS